LSELAHPHDSAVAVSAISPILDTIHKDGVGKNDTLEIWGVRKNIEAVDIRVNLLYLRHILCQFGKAKNIDIQK
jgi:hypothetical protein